MVFRNADFPNLDSPDSIFPDSIFPDSVLFGLIRSLQTRCFLTRFLRTRFLGLSLELSGQSGSFLLAWLGFDLSIRSFWTRFLGFGLKSIFLD